MRRSRQRSRRTADRVSSRYRSFKGKAVTYQDFERVCLLAAAVVEAVGLYVKSGDEFFAEMEENLVRHVLMDRRPVTHVPENGEDPSGPRSALAESIARAYRRLNAEKTLFDMLREAVKRDKRATQAVMRGMRRAPR